MGSDDLVLLPSGVHRRSHLSTWGVSNPGSMSEGELKLRERRFRALSADDYERTACMRAILQSMLVRDVIVAAASAQ